MPELVTPSSSMRERNVIRDPCTGPYATECALDSELVGRVPVLERSRYAVCLSSSSSEALGLGTKHCSSHEALGL